MTKQEHIAHLEKRLAEAVAANDKNMVAMFAAKIKNLKGERS
jgi:hypothetical protein